MCEPSHIQFMGGTGTIAVGTSTKPVDQSSLWLESKLAHSSAQNCFNSLRFVGYFWVFYTFFRSNVCINIGNYFISTLYYLSLCSYSTIPYLCLFFSVPCKGNDNFMYGRDYGVCVYFALWWKKCSSFLCELHHLVCWYNCLSVALIAYTLSLCLSLPPFLCDSDRERSRTAPSLS